MKNRIWIICLTIVLLAISIWFSDVHESENLHFSVRISVNGMEETVHCQSASDGRYYVFLPSYAELSQTYICVEEADEIVINGQALYDGLCCDAFEENVVYDFETEGERGELVFSRPTGVPSMHIDTRSGSMDYIHANKENKETATFRLYTSEGTCDHCESEIIIEGRGNYTWDAYDKKPYNITLTKEASLLEMGQAQNWILLANASDESNLRNKLVYDFAAEIGIAYTPETALTELYLNGEYVGLYLLSEKNEMHSQRVAIERSGSFLVSAELESRLKKQNYPYVTTPSGQTFRLHGMKDVTQEEKQRIENILTSVENAIFSADGIDPDSGKHRFDLIDLESWVKKYLIEEVFGNIDACLISQFYYYDTQKGCVLAGPVWDYDFSLGNDKNWKSESPYVFVANQLRMGENSSTAWFVELYKDPMFYQALTGFYQTEFLPKVNDFLESRIDMYAERIQTECLRDGLRWNTVGKAEQEVARIKTFLKERIKLLSEIWLENKEYSILHLTQGTSVYYPVLQGQLPPVLPTLSDTEKDVFLGWYYVGTDEPFDASKPITEDISLYAKWVENPQDKIRDILKLAPTAVMTVVFVAMLVIEAKKLKDRRGR